MDGDDLAQLERDRLRALVERDIPRAMTLHGDDYELITPGGVTYDCAGYLSAIERGELRYRVFEPIGEVRARIHEATAILRYRVTIDIGFEDGHEAGEYWHTDYWERREDEWRAVWSHATRIRSATA